MLPILVMLMQRGGSKVNGSGAGGLDMSVEEGESVWQSSVLLLNVSVFR